MLYGTNWNANYYAYGEVAAQSGSDTENRYSFTGKEKDSNIGLMYYGWRYYDPVLGRWLALDPAGQGWSPYAYGGNNPVIMVDPDGRFIFETLIILGALTGGYQGHQIAQAKGVTGLSAFGYVLAGATIGGASAYLGGVSAPSVGGVFSGGISTFTNSFGMMALSSGEIGLSSQLGPLTISESGIKLANPFTDRGALKSLMGWSTLAGDLYSLYGHYRENQRIKAEAPELSGRNKEVKQMLDDSFDLVRNPSDPIHEEGAWLSENNFQRVPAGGRNWIRTGPKPDWATSFIHTHPNETGILIASETDHLATAADKVKYGYILARDKFIWIFYPVLQKSYPIAYYERFVNKWWLYGHFLK